MTKFEELNIEEVEAVAGGCHRCAGSGPDCCVDPVVLEAEFGFETVHSKS